MHLSFIDWFPVDQGVILRGERGTEGGICKKSEDGRGIKMPQKVEINMFVTN